MDWSHLSNAEERKYPNKIIENGYSDLITATNGLIQLKLYKLPRTLQKYAGLKDPFQFYLELKSEFVPEYNFRVFHFGFSADLEIINVIIDRQIYVDVFNQIPNQPSVAFYNNHEFTNFLEAVFKSRKFINTAAGLRTMALVNKNQSRV